MRQTQLAYAQVRIQAQLARCPTALDWQLIETGRDFSQCLETARRTALARFVSALNRDSAWTEIEEALRHAWSDMVVETARWLPAAWRPALCEFAALPHLRSIENGRAEGICGGAALADLAAEGVDISLAWQDRFGAVLPAPDPGLLTDLSPLLDRYLSGPPRSAGDGTALAASLKKLLRSRLQEPVAIFAWIGVMVLATERLRGALLVARLFRDGETGGER